MAKSMQRLKALPRPIAKKLSAPSPNAALTTNDQSSLERLERIVKWATIVTGIAAIFQAVFAGLQWRYSVWSFEQQDASSTAAAASAAAQTDRLIAAANRSASSGEASVGAAREGIASALQQSKVGLEASRTGLRQEQRAWIYLRDVEVLAEPLADGLPHAVGVRTHIVNAGKSPAQHLTTRAALTLIAEGAATSRDAARWQRPSAPTVVFPNQDGMFHNYEVEFTSAQIVAYRARAVALTVESVTCFEDAFGRPHWTRTCVQHLHGRGLSDFRSCNTGNEADTDEKSGACPK